MDGMDGTSVTWDLASIRREIEAEFRALSRFDRRDLWLDRVIYSIGASNAMVRPLAPNEPEPGLFVCAECGCDFESRYAGVVVCTPGCARERDARIGLRTRDRNAENAKEAARIAAIVPSARSLAVQAAIARKKNR